MPKSRLCCLLLLVLGGLHLVTGIVSRSGCSGESIFLYGNISFNTDNIAVSLYKNGDNNTLLAMWTKDKSPPIKDSYENGYGKKILLEEGNILIRNLSKSDEGKYFILIALGTWSIKQEVQLDVMVAPSAKCIPNITHVKNTLAASLDIEECGSPAAHVSWYKIGLGETARQPRKLNSHLDWNLKKISTGNKAGTYCACAESPAMYCDRRSNRMKFCSCLNTKEKNIRAISTISTEMTTSSEVSELTRRDTDMYSQLLNLREMDKGLLSFIIIISFAIVALVAMMISLLRRKKVGDPDSYKEEETRKLPSGSGKVSFSLKNPEIAEENETSTTTTISSEGEKEEADSSGSENGNSILQSPGLYRKIPRSPKKEVNTTE